MTLAFTDDLHDELGSWPAAYIPYGGADLGEILAVGRSVGDGGDDTLHAAWTAAAERHEDAAEAAAGASVSERLPSAGPLSLASGIIGPFMPCCAAQQYQFRT